MAKTTHLCGIGNALIDIFIDVSEEIFSELDLEKGTMRLVDAHEQEQYLAALATKELPRVSGGSVVNSLIAFAQLGGKATCIGCVGDDANGIYYRHELQQLGVHFPVEPLPGGRTGTVLVFNTPDAERTMRTHLGCSIQLSSKEVDEASISDSEWLFIEGYLFSTENGQEAIRTAVKLAKANETKIALTMSEAWVVETFRPQLEEVLESTDLVFSNETEALAYGRTHDLEGAIATLHEKVEHVVVTRGEKGALVSRTSHNFSVPAYPCTPIDVTGAGDMFAGAYLYGLVSGEDPKTAVKRACYLSSKVISKVGARIQDGVRGYWEEI